MENDLIDAAADLLGEVGPRAMTVRSIAQRVGVNHGLIHHYFGGKQPLLEAAAIAGIRPIIFRQEGTGIHMVDGYSRVTNGRRIGVFMMQNGPGAENGFAGVAQAYAESVPILLLPAGFARNRRGVHPNFNPTRSYETITKWSQEINLVERIPDLMRRAFAKLRSGRLGPVLLEIPQDIALGELKPELFNYTSPPRLRQAADPEAIKQAARVLLEAKNPILHAGQGVLYAEATDELVHLAEFLQAPVMTTLPGKSAFPENHPLSVGASGPAGGMWPVILSGAGRLAA